MESVELYFSCVLLIGVLGVFIYVLIGIIIAHNGIHYFVSASWPPVLTFPAPGTDILCELRSLLDACP